MTTRRALWTCATAAVFLLFQMCATNLLQYTTIEQSIFSGNYPQAVAEVERQRAVYGDKSDVLYSLDLGTCLHYDKQYDRCFRAFQAAERRMQDLWTISVSTEAAALLVNDNMLDYGGEDHEKVLVNLFMAISFAEQGRFESALVEARKVDTKLKEIASLYEGKNSYQEDAFVRYVTGVMYEAGGEMNDAYIAYRNAAQIYDQSFTSTFGVRMPAQLTADLVRAAEALHFTDERDSHMRRFGVMRQPYDPNEGSVFVIVYSGKGPIKVERRFEARIMDMDGIFHSVALAVPKYVDREPNDQRYSVTLNGGGKILKADTEVGEDVGALAKKALEDRLTLLYLRTGGRAVLKFLAKEEANKQIKKEYGEGATASILSLLGSAVMDATESADLRAWRTLPKTIQVARIYAPPGTYQLAVDRGFGAPLARRSVEVRSRSVSFLFFPDVH